MRINLNFLFFDVALLFSLWTIIKSKTKVRPPYFLVSIADKIVSLSVIGRIIRARHLKFSRKLRTLTVSLFKHLKVFKGNFSFKCFYFPQCKVIETEKWKYSCGKVLIFCSLIAEINWKLDLFWISVLFIVIKPITIPLLWKKWVWNFLLKLYLTKLKFMFYTK